MIEKMTVGNLTCTEKNYTLVKVSYLFLSDVHSQAKAFYYMHLQICDIPSN